MSDKPPGKHVLAAELTEIALKIPDPSSLLFLKGLLPSYSMSTYILYHHQLPCCTSVCWTIRSEVDDATLRTAADVNADPEHHPNSLWSMRYLRFQSAGSTLPEPAPANLWKQRS